MTSLGGRSWVIKMMITMQMLVIVWRTDTMRIFGTTSLLLVLLLLMLVLFLLLLLLLLLM